MAVSFNPADFTEGLLDDVRAVVKKSDFVLYDYNGKLDHHVPALHWALLPEGAEDDEANYQHQYWGCGDIKDFIPSEDGEALNPVGRRTAPNKTANIALLIRSLVDKGMPVDKLQAFAAKASTMEGADLHFMRQAAPKRNFADQEEGGEKRGSQVLLVSQVYSLPWEKLNKGKTGKDKSAAPAEDAGAGGDLEDQAADALIALLTEKGAITRKQLPALLFKATGKNKALVDLAFTEEFLNGNPSWVYENGKISLPE